MRPPPPPPPQQPIPLLLLPADLLLSITTHLSPSSILSLILTSRHLHRFLLPTYHRISAAYPSALLHAASCPSPQLLTTLLAHGANPNTSDAHGLSPLDHASRLGHSGIITQLLSARATLDIQKGGRQPYPLFSPLDLAAKAGNVETLALLLAELRKRYTPDKVSDAIGRALLHAVQERRGSAVQWILEHTTPPRERLQEALTKAVTLNSPPIARILLDHGGADPNSLTPDQPTTLLHRAAERNRVALVELLLEYGAAVDVRDGVGLMPLHYAVKGCAGDALEALLEAGADLDQGSGLGTPFSGALRRGWVGGVEIMVAWGLQIGWDVREKWSLVKQRRMKAVEEGFLRAVTEVMGEQAAIELTQQQSERYG